MIETEWTQEGLSDKADILATYLTGKYVALGIWDEGIFVEASYPGYGRQTLSASVASASDGEPLVIGAVQFDGPTSGDAYGIAVLALMDGIDEIKGTATISPVQTLPVGSVQRFNLTFRP